MVAIRLLIALAAFLIGASFAVYLFTRNKLYLQVAWQLFRFFIVLFAAIVLFFLVERLAFL